jgi:hypothetical protein
VQKYEIIPKPPNFLEENCFSDVKKGLFVGQEGLGEHFLGFTKKHLLVVVPL